MAATTSSQETKTRTGSGQSQPKALPTVCRTLSSCCTNFDSCMRRGLDMSWFLGAAPDRTLSAIVLHNHASWKASTSDAAAAYHAVAQRSSQTLSSAYSVTGFMSPPDKTSAKNASMEFVVHEQKDFFASANAMLPLCQAQKGCGDGGRARCLLQTVPLDVRATEAPLSQTTAVALALPVCHFGSQGRSDLGQAPPPRHKSQRTYLLVPIHLLNTDKKHS